MDLRLSDEQEMLRDMLARYLRETYDFETRRSRIADVTGHDARLWQDFAELGVTAAALPEATGGLGGGAQAAMIILEALGEALAVTPYLETVVQGAALLEVSGGPWAEALLPEIASGTVRLAFAQAEPASHHCPHRVATRAERSDDGWRLTGEKVVVVGAPAATHILVAARIAGDISDRAGISLFVVPADTPGLHLHPYRLIDERAAADIRFAGLHLPDTALLGTEGQALAAIETAEVAAISGLCAEAVGVLRRMVEDSVAYTRQRRQFGRPIAELQALQHRMVDMRLALEQAISATYLATLNLASPAMRDRATAAAKVTISRAARFIGESAVQLHGAMGMTEELAISHYFKRAATIQTQFGSADHHLARYAALRAA